MQKLKFSKPYRAKEDKHPDSDLWHFDTLYIDGGVIGIFYDQTDMFIWRAKCSINKRHGLHAWVDCQTGYGDAGSALRDALEYLGWTPPA